MPNPGLFAIHQGFTGYLNKNTNGAHLFFNGFFQEKPVDFYISSVDVKKCRELKEALQELLEAAEKG